MPKLCSTLEACTAPDDQDVVQGLLQAIFGKLPAEIVAKRLDKEMRANDMCRVRVLRHSGLAKQLESVGVSVGDSMVLEDAIYAPVASPPPAMMLPATGGGHAPRAPAMRAFPDLGTSKYPSLIGWDAYRQGLRSRVQGDVSPGVVAQLKAVDAGNPVPTDWLDGTAEDRHVYSQLMTGTGAMPDELVALIPAALKAASAGIRVYAHIHSNGHTI